MDKIARALEDSNPWWKEEFHLVFKPRHIYENIKKYLDMPQIISLTGLRRVGKTTLMKKIIKDYLDKGISSDKIIYFSFDQFQDLSIQDLIDKYESLLNVKFGKDNLLLLDEIQKLDNWDEQLKRLYDNFKDKIKIIISGSESLFIKSKSKATLAGRLFEFEVKPLTFKEFLNFKEFDYEPINLYENELKSLFDDYLLTQGLPELVDIKDKEIISKYVQESIVDKVVYKDFLELFNLKKNTIIKKLLNIFMYEPGQIIRLEKLANQQGITRQTLSKYIKLLEESFLLKKLYNYSKSRQKTERRLKKYYPLFLSTEILFSKDTLLKSKVFEWFIVRQLNAEYFWRSSSKDEVDIIKEGVPVEIKYGKINYKGIKKYMNKYSIKEGYIISKDDERMVAFDNKKINVIPAFKFLLIKNKIFENS